jgi:hypothetical protein
MIHPTDIDHRFNFHPAGTEEKQNAHGSVREQCRELAHFLNEKIPDGREKSIVITKLEEVMMWANAALARDNRVRIHSPGN